MSKYLKMADGFDFDEAAIEQRLFGGCISKEEATYAAHAVVSHDELVEMNRELLEALGEAAKAMLFAHQSMFSQCLSNPVFNAWGGELDLSSINHLQLASSSFRKVIAKAKGESA